MTTRQIVIVQNGYAIFGVGPSLDAAIADATEWLDDPVELIGLPSHSSIHGELYWAYCTPALAEKVRKSGGDFAWHELNDGTLCLPDED